MGRPGGRGGCGYRGRRGGMRVSGEVRSFFLVILFEWKVLVGKQFPLFS